MALIGFFAATDPLLLVDVAAVPVDVTLVPAPLIEFWEVADANTVEDELGPTTVALFPKLVR